MKKMALLSACLVLFAALAVLARAGAVAPAPNGITLPPDFRSWPTLSLTYRQDNQTMRAILANPVAVAAAQAGKTNPWPDGALLVKVVWKATALGAWPSAQVPADFDHVEIMLKDARRWPETGGWGFARWVGLELKPYGKDPAFVKECFACHLPVKDRDYVFTLPPKWPATN